MNYEKIGRGLCQIRGGVLSNKNAYAAFGDPDWKNYEFEFDAKVPLSAKKVEIWAGFHAMNRVDRYVIALKGGIQNDLYLARRGYMGTDDFLALRHLDFSLQPGRFYHMKVQVIGNRIRVFLNDENRPRIDIIDKYASFAPRGKVTLGGSWIENDFKDLSIRSFSSDELTHVAAKEYAIPAIDKEALRERQRAAYKPIRIKDMQPARTVISLNGRWLFKPGYEVNSPDQAISPVEADMDWNVLTVPNFWNPLRIWLFGERYKSASKGTSDSYYQKEIDRCKAYTFDYTKTDVGWYRQWVDLPSGIKGRHLTLHFDAVSKLAEVWINGKKAGEHIGMFGDFNVDGTGLFKPGKNLIAVKVIKNYLKQDNNLDSIVGVAVSEEVTQKMLKDLPHGFYDDDPAGIWQPVSLIITDPVKIKNVFIKSNLNGASFSITVQNYSHKKQNIALGTQIISCTTGKPLYKGPSIEKIELNGGERKKLTYSVDNLKPKLWSPAHPNLYNFHFILDDIKDGKKIDEKVVRSGFKTFEAKDGYFYLNGKRYWLRGANQTAMPIAPNDTALARRFCRLMHDANINITRTHTTPYTETWMNASDENGIGISFEGTWPWLMIGDSPIPDSALLNIWKNEFYDLIRKYRNHPSLMIWTINNEMNFYVDDHNKDRAKKKMKIISDVVKNIRKIDPVHPVCYSSNYSRRQVEKRFGKDFMKTIDDGDMDDIHYYPNWYNNSIFADFNGQFQKNHKYPGRPLISQELSTGYPDETGHATRFYTLVHQTPQALIGKYAYAYKDPKYFLQTNAFITKEEAEALRRTNPGAAGILHFSLATWFKNVYLAKKIRPFPTYYAIKKALQPVLVTAELWGRHFYAGARINSRICVVNDRESGKALPETSLVWQLVETNGKVIASGEDEVPPVKYYGRQWIEPQITIPAILPHEKMKCKLVLRLSARGRLLSENEYNIVLATRNWTRNKEALADKKLVVVDFSKNISRLLDSLDLKYASFSSLQKALKQKADLYVIAGLDSSVIPTEGIKNIRSVIERGGKMLILNSNIAPELYPQYIRSIIKANPQIVTMDIPESPVFKGIEPLEMRYFNNNKRAIPEVCAGAFQINRDPHVITLASSEKVHGYLQGNIYERSRSLDKIKGFPIVKINDNGTAILSTLLLGKGVTDPIAGKLLSNLLAALLK